MSIYGSKSKRIPILDYELRGSISDELGENKMRWSNQHVFTTLVGTFTVQKMRRWNKYRRYDSSIFIGPLCIDYDRPDFSTYMSGDAECLNSRIKK